MHPAGADPPELADQQCRNFWSVRVTLIAPDGRVLGDSEVPRAGFREWRITRDRPEFIDARRGGRGASIRHSSTLGVIVHLRRGQRSTMAPSFAWRCRCQAVDVLLSGLRRQLAFAMLIGIGLSLAFGYMVYAVVSRPLHKVAEASLQLAYGNLESEIPVVGDSDLATVGSSLNAMARNLRLKMAELEADKHRTDAVIAAMSAGVVVFDRAARVVLSNSSIQTLLGLHRAAAGTNPDGACSSSLD